MHDDTAMALRKMQNMIVSYSQNIIMTFISITIGVQLNCSKRMNQEEKTRRYL